ncbi:uncharacterized protein BJ171DRAFT_493943 [Polychytrium aggregatum]|uniref:uncharacterized protein n=1 Tax=Polychytrium aggregatum TaxID=110093 RepID=UPI0022FE7C90|nr:uncharacterized protein BJ171DRAFT_493943 [Polychytrium aggregatum]KAI9207224.1 hypothetical protein BJ171DRAFT_493943 [Polychytrium aggregatum]
MPPKNAKAAAALEKKAAVQAEKDKKKAQEKEKVDAAEWSKGAKDGSKKDEAERKRLEALAKKAERDALLDAEEKQTGGGKVKGADKRAAAKEAKINNFQADNMLDLAEYSASGIDNALDLLSLTTTEAGTNASGSDRIERHPEKRMKSAWAVFEEREMPLLKAENPTLRLSQLKQQLQKKWKKSPDNPMNQAHISFDVKAQDEREMIAESKDDQLESFRK